MMSRAFRIVFQVLVALPALWAGPSHAATSKVLICNTGDTLINVAWVRQDGWGGWVSSGWLSVPPSAWPCPEMGRKTGQPSEEYYLAIWQLNADQKAGYAGYDVARRDQMTIDGNVTGEVIEIVPRAGDIMKPGGRGGGIAEVMCVQDAIFERKAGSLTELKHCGPGETPALYTLHLQASLMGGPLQENAYTIRVKSSGRQTIYPEINAPSLQATPSVIDATPSPLLAGIDVDGLMFGRIQPHLSTPLDHPLEFALGYEVADEIYHACGMEVRDYQKTRHSMETLLQAYMLHYYPLGRVRFAEKTGFGKGTIELARQAAERIGAMKKARGTLAPEAPRLARNLVDRLGGCQGKELGALVRNLSQIVTFSGSNPPPNHTGAVLVESSGTLDGSGLHCIYDSDPDDMRAERQIFLALTSANFGIFSSEAGLVLMSRLQPGEKAPMVRTACPGIPDPDVLLESIARQPELPTPSAAAGGTRIERVADYFANVYAPTLLKEHTPDVAYDDAMKAMIRRFIVNWEGINVTQAERDAVRQAEIDRLKAGGHDPKTFISGNAARPGDRFDDRARWRKYEDLYGFAIPKEEKLRTQRDRTLSMLIMNYQSKRSSFASIK